MSDLLDLADGDYDADVRWRGMVLEDVTALTAATFPVKPPLAWFDDPNLTAVTPLTIENSGQVFGHIAAWHTSHIGIAGGVKPPRSKSNYAFFRTGVLETENGDMVDVGQVTLAGGHAPLDATVARAVAHYDNTESAIMDVAAGEDKYGIWVAGALRPEVSDEQVRSIRASSVSGDWRPINGRLELVAVCAVNAPGFPVPRARVAGGAPVALVAAGVEPLIEASLRVQAGEDVEAGIEAGLATFRERINHLEAVVIAHGNQADVGPLATELADSLRERVHDPERTAVIAALRKKAKGNGDSEEDEDEEVPEKLKKLPKAMQERAMKLRKKVKGNGVKASAEDIGREAGEALAASLRLRVKGTNDPLPDPEADALLAASLRQRVRGWWDPKLHPRGKDGQFIEKGGWVSGPVQWYGDQGEVSQESRVKVIDIRPQIPMSEIGLSAPETFEPSGNDLVVESADGRRRGRAQSSQMTQVVAPVAQLPAATPERQPFR
jgi:hypothetical protein